MNAITKNWKPTVVAIIITISSFAAQSSQDPFDRDLYHAGQLSETEWEKRGSEALYPLYPSGDPRDQYSVNVRGINPSGAAAYYRENLPVSSFALRNKAERLERIGAKAFYSHNSYPVSLRDILDLTNNYGDRFNRDGYSTNGHTFSQLPEIDLQNMDSYWSQAELQKFAEVLYEQFDKISDRIARVAYNSLLKNSTDNGLGAERFVYHVLGDSFNARKSFSPSKEKWDGTDNLSILVKQHFRDRYPRVFRSADDKNYSGPFLSSLQILFKNNYVSTKQKNALIKGFEKLAEDLMNENDNLAAFLVGKSIKQDFERYGISDFRTYSKRSASISCRRHYTTK